MFEHLVRTYSVMKYNSINNEASFIQFYLRSIFTRVFHTIQGDKDELLPCESLIVDLHRSLTLPTRFSSLGGASCVCFPLAH